MSVTGDRKKYSIALSSMSRRQRKQQTAKLQKMTLILLSYFSRRNRDAIIRVIRIALEKLRKRIMLTFDQGEMKSII